MPRWAEAAVKIDRGCPLPEVDNKSRTLGRTARRAHQLRSFPSPGRAFGAHVERRAENLCSVRTQAAALDLRLRSLRRVLTLVVCTCERYSGDSERNSLARFETTGRPTTSPGQLIWVCGTQVRRRITNSVRSRNHGRDNGQDHSSGSDHQRRGSNINQQEETGARTLLQAIFYQGR